MNFWFQVKPNSELVIVFLHQALTPDT